MDDLHLRDLTSIDAISDYLSKCQKFFDFDSSIPRYIFYICADEEGYVQSDVPSAAYCLSAENRLDDIYEELGIASEDDEYGDEIVNAENFDHRFYLNSCRSLLDQVKDALKELEAKEKEETDELAK